MKFWLIILMGLTLSCEKKNIFDDFASSNSDEALYLEARKHLDEFEFDDTIAIIENRLSVAYRAQKKVRSTLMYAYGGKCGISFLQIVNRMQNTTETKLFPLAMDLFQQTQVDSVHCETAAEILAGLGAASVRTTNENLFGAILGLAQVGTTLKEGLDTDDDGQVDAGADVCQASGALSDARINRVSAGIGLIFENISAITAQIDNSGMVGGLQDAQQICETPFFPGIASSPQTYDPGIPFNNWSDFGTSLGLTLSDPPTFAQLGLPDDVADPIDCLNTTPTGVNAKMRRTVRRLLESSEVGVGTCDITQVNVTINTNPNLSFVPTMQCCPTLVVP